jgi:hypothetical protein
MSVINVKVTPTGGSGSKVRCDFASNDPEFVDNAIFVPKNQASTIYFTLVPGNGVGAWNSTASNGAFCAEHGKCPRKKAPPPGQQDGQFTAHAPAGKVLRVDVAASPATSVAHYRLRFDNGSCDPIIINH